MQEAARASAEAGATVMEIDVRFKARDIATLLFHPNARKLEGKRTHIVGRAGAESKDEAGRSSGQSSGGGSHESTQDQGMVTAGRDPAETMDVGMAIKQREEEGLAALVASVTVEVRSARIRSRRSILRVGDVNDSCALLLMFQRRVLRISLSRICSAFAPTLV